MIKRIHREKRIAHSGAVVNFNLLKVALSLFVILGICCTGFAFGQDAQVLDQNSLTKFRIAKIQFYRGEQYFNKGNMQKAEKALTECLENFPNYAYAYFYLSRIAYDKKDFAKALECIVNAKKTYKIFADLSASTYQEYLDQLREQKTYLEMQLGDLKQKLASTPSNATDQQNIYQRAISSYEGNVMQINNRLNSPVSKLAETPADYFYIHGNVLFKMNKYQDAFEQYMLTVQTDPKHSNALGNLANLYYMSKQYQNALDSLDKAESYGFKPNPKFRTAIMEALKQ